MRANTETKVGCCGFTASQKEYFRLFNQIEIQKTFYQLPQLRTAEKWRRMAPPGFEFTLKAWQLITHEPSSPTYHRLKDKIRPEKGRHYGHFRFTAEVVKAWEQTAEFAQALGARVVVFQCPARFRPTKENICHMQKFFTGIDRQGFSLVWEPRGVWPEELILRLCRKLDLIHCVDPFKNEPQYGNFRYFRLHGITGYSYRYTDKDLSELKTWAEKKPTYVFFNNMWMKDDALRFLRLIQDER